MPDESQGNETLASLFHRIAQMLEVTGADRFRVIAHDRAARLIESHPEDLAAIARKHGPKPLTAIEGIGPKIADKIAEFASTGRIAEHDELVAAVPPGLLELFNVPGLGPKTIRALWQEKNVTSIDDLKRIIHDGSIMDLPRMGAKTVANIKEAIEFSEHAAERIPLGIAWPIAEAIVRRMSKVKGVTQAAFAGSLRRGRETIGDLDILVESNDADAARDAFTTMKEVTKVIAAGEAKCSVRLEIGGRHVQADLRIVPPGSWGAALLYFTGSKEHNIRLRERAQKSGMTLNEYGLYIEDKAKSPPHLRGVKPVASRDEQAIFKALGLPEAPPELREDRNIDEPPPEHLIELADIKAELHAHTTASDGRMSIDELAEHAKARGFHTIAVTDHSQSSALAGGLRPDALRKHIDNVREANERAKGITILAGSEVDIRADGSLDYDDELLARLDIVVASPHASLRQDARTATDRLLRAITHPLVHIIGHPTGRIINKREGFHPDINELAAAAAQHRTALELNANWLRLDLRDTHLRAALAAGKGNTLIAIDCDVHHPDDFENLRFGVLTARRAALTSPSCVNTWPAKKLHHWLQSKRT
ncbi:MAG: DNA polymerase/3'-5' exonuclease PolX [Phycisphaerae bacterium]|nr:DNA polymerase/3'-5' exonuclease PolX [Phycisphaerae bacterium]